MNDVAPEANCLRKIPIGMKSRFEILSARLVNRNFYKRVKIRRQNCSAKSI
jgi:hypothetical protein